MEEKKLSRKEHILQALAAMLENCPGQRITTAKLADEVGVSEAALYRHFPSKAKMFEGLIQFVEEVIFSRINRIAQGDLAAEQKIHQVLLLLLGFFEQNPGITRIFTGDAISGEHPRLHQRIAQFYERVESQLRNILKEYERETGIRPNTPIAIAANVLLATAEGRINQFVRSDFKKAPTQYWGEQWQLLMGEFFKTPVQ